MARPTEAANRDNREALERRWIRLQEIGLIQLLAIPVMIAIVGTIMGFTVKGDAVPVITNALVMGTLALVMSGCVCLEIGYEKRCELRDQEDSTE